MKKYSSLILRIGQEESGVLSFEWMLLSALLVIGIVGGLATMRDMLICQFGAVSSAAGHLDQSCGYTDCPYLEGGTFVDSRATQNDVVTLSTTP